MGRGGPNYVAETDAQARKDFEPHFWYFVRNLLKGINLAPPGYTSAQSAAAIVKNRPLFLLEKRTWAEVEEGVYAIVGSPETVRQKLAHYQKELGCGVMLTGCQTGTLNFDQSRRSMELLAREVIPHVKGPVTAPAFDSAVIS